MINLQQLKQLRKARQISNLLGFSSANAYWRMEHGLTPLKADHLHVLAKHLHCSLDSFFLNEEEGDNNE
ncbi:helix-turn-helix domain-containing protein [Paenibacillus sp. P46E]|uniref:helix-turn-helix domain-containing protein n=1 Tax=Paenibacillus sp. P46E TaxID=1349436 RepID=UPI00093BE7BA|nr:helix-turn-helix transcriptional regulator [Paenibacillus sp. P46E]OKP99231.1 hypothetical protein A3849_06060 [Paenibacillus sp. P46E]